ncbi:MAG TPA: hypothetical protein VF042_03085 [Gemmatimonadaceae bacterium]
MNIALAIILGLHGFAHLVGFAAPWGLAGEGVPQLAIFGGRIAVGETIMRGLGMLWLTAAVLFIVSAIALLKHAEWWEPFTVGVALFSLIMCVMFAPQASVGIAINVLLLAFIAVNRSASWIHLAG